MTPKEFNRSQIKSGKLKDEHIDHLIEVGATVVQQHAGITVDGKVGDNTLAAINNILHPRPAPPPPVAIPVHVNIKPVGKALYIRRLTELGKPAELARQAKWAGLSWIAIESTWQDTGIFGVRTGRPNKRSVIAEYAAAFRAEGIEVWVWGYPYPGHEDAFADSMKLDCEAAQAKGLLIDPEKPYKDHPTQATDLVKRLEYVCKKNHWGLGITSYAATWAHKTFPFKQFANSVAWGSPQVYDKDNNQGPGYAARAVKAWEDLGFGPLVMSGPVYNKTPAQLRAHLATFPKHIDAVVFWDWKNLTVRRNLGLWDVLREYKPGV